MKRNQGQALETSTGVRAGTALSVTLATSLIATATGVSSVGSLASPLNIIATDFVHRFLTGRQRSKVVTVVQHAAQCVVDARAQGMHIRSDGFFLDRDGRWTADEVIESVLLVASNCPQDFKLEHLGHMLAFFALTDALDPSSAIWTLKHAEDLTWTQYVLLAILANDDLQMPDADITPPSGEDRTWDLLFMFDQLADLGYSRRSLMDGGKSETGYARLPIPDMNASHQKLTTSGRMLVAALSLDSIDQSIQSEHLQLIQSALASRKP